MVPEPLAWWAEPGLNGGWIGVPPPILPLIGEGLIEFETQATTYQAVPPPFQGEARRGYSSYVLAALALACATRSSGMSSKLA
jgi:hypothetical protein